MVFQSPRDPEAEATDRIERFASRFMPTIHPMEAGSQVVPKAMRPTKKVSLPMENLSFPEVGEPVAGQSVARGDILHIEPLFATGSVSADGRVGAKFDGVEVFVPRGMIQRYERGSPTAQGETCRHKFGPDDGPLFRVVTVVGAKGWFESVGSKEDDFVSNLNTMTRVG